MADETDTTSEVARVLNLHASFKASEEIQDPNTPWYWECDGCDTRLVLSGTYGRPEVIAALAAHQAAMLAEAGLLRDHATIDALNQRCQILVDEGDRLRAQIAAQEPAGATQGGSGDSRASGGLGERLRALVPAIYADDGYFGVTALEIRELADEADRLENEAEMQRHSARSWRVQAEHAQSKVERVRALADKYAQGRGGPTARRIREALDGEVAP